MISSDRKGAIFKTVYLGNTRGWCRLSLCIQESTCINATQQRPVSQITVFAYEILNLKKKNYFFLLLTLSFQNAMCFQNTL